ncbi:hypothetical protein D3C72_1734690 [compost metagenome]
MDVCDLDNDELLAQAKEWRLKALRGERDARGLAHELEGEVRRRIPSTYVPLVPAPVGELRVALGPQKGRRRFGDLCTKSLLHGISQTQKPHEGDSQIEVGIWSIGWAELT